VEKLARPISRGASVGVKIGLYYLVYYPAKGFTGIDRGSITVRDNFYDDPTMITGSTAETLVFNVK
ncbi:MAG: hypothetical protein VYD64_06315, partial [Pseudomonadota bacterium]|nr:hypothetical protein [Pseudomonadota bacterium]